MEQKLRFGLFFGALGSTEKKIRTDYEQLLRSFFSYYCIRTNKLHKMQVKKNLKKIIMNFK
jgi:hypothetical protein